MNLFLITLVIIAVSMLSLWLISFVIKDASIMDIFWGMGFALLTVISYGLTEGYPPRKQLLTLLVVFWGFRLAFHLAWRHHGEGEDFRYQVMRRKYGARFSIVSLLIVFGLQGASMWIISLPLQAAQISPTPDQLTLLEKSLVETKPGYWSYARRTSAFFPWFPKREAGG
jgi:steroid 5-alpha reductase family enzyme